MNWRREACGLWALLTLAACSPAGALVQVEDPQQVARDADRLEVWTSARPEPSSVELPEDGFPVTFVLTGQEGLTGEVFVGARAGERRIAVGSAQVELSKASPSVVIALEAGCDSDQDCDDGRFCTGAERCSLGRCVQGDLPCGAAFEGCVTWVCVEAAAACEVALEAVLDDREPCTEDLCWLGEVRHPARPDGTPCPTGLCEGGVCVP